MVLPKISSPKSHIILAVRGGVIRMNVRKLSLGDKNLVGCRVTQARKLRGMKQVELLSKLQLAGVDMSKKEPVESAMELFESLLNELESMM